MLFAKQGECVKYTSTHPSSRCRPRIHHTDIDALQIAMNPREPSRPSVVLPEEPHTATFLPLQPYVEPEPATATTREDLREELRTEVATGFRECHLPVPPIVLLLTEEQARLLATRMRNSATRRSATRSPL